MVPGDDEGQRSGLHAEKVESVCGAGGRVVALGRVSAFDVRFESILAADARLKAGRVLAEVVPAAGQAGPRFSSKARCKGAREVTDGGEVVDEQVRPWLALQCQVSERRIAE